MVESDTGQSSISPDPVMDATLSGSQNSDTSMTPKFQVVAPEPLPTFVFPARAPTQASSLPDASSGPAPLLPHEMSPRIPSSLHSRRKSVAPLPTFNFNPGHNDPYEGKVSPKTPDTSSPLPPPRSGGHKRGGSEFIGGDGMSGGLGLISVSPTKGHGVLPLPRFQTSPVMPGGRRGHTHRRSGAISCHDLSGISRPSAIGTSSRPESAPTSPSDTNVFVGLDSVENRPVNDDATEISPTPRRILESWPLRGGEGGPPRARVGFSDNIEFIPRGLSPLSSEGSSSDTTIRGIESSAGSLSSIISAGSNSDNVVSSDNTVEQEAVRYRPTSAGPVMVRRESAEDRPFGDMGSAFERPSSVPSSRLFTSARRPRSSEDDVFDSADGGLPRPFLWSASQDLAHGRNTPGHGRAAIESGLAMARGLGLDPPSLVPSLGPKKDRKAAKNQERTSRLAGSIVPRRRRPDERFGARRTLSPPPQALSPRKGSPDIDFDNDDTTVIVSPDFRYSIPPPTSTGSGDLPRQDPSLSLDFNSVIDLDAPLDSAQTVPRSKDSPRSRFEIAKRRMHSFGATGGFRGPGMDYHRRTESAPEMASSEFGRSSLHRLRNSGTMADVFEEDEEDDEDVKGLRGRAESSEDQDTGKIGMGIQVADLYDQTNIRVLDLKDEDPGTNKDNKGELRETGQTESKTEEGTEKEQSAKAAVGTARQVKRHGEAVVTDKRSQSWPSARISGATAEPVPGTVREGSIAADSVGLGLPHRYRDRMTADTPSLTVSSSASPDPATSTFDQPSVQTPSIFTSRTSITDERAMPSWSTGEPSPDMRMSTDDIPSLASDNTSAVYSYASPASRPYSNDGGAPGIAIRSGSMTSYATSGSGLANPRPTTAKRSSLVSLSRLVGASRAERSKLSIEERPKSKSPETPGKEKKTKRLGRLISSILKTKQNR